MNFKDFPIELWQVRRFEGDLISIMQLHKSKDAQSLKSITQKNNQLEIIINEVVVYSEETHLDEANEEIKELYEVFKMGVLGLSSAMTLDPKKHYIAFKSEKNIIDIALQKKALKLWLNAKWGELDDFKSLARNVSNIGHYGNGDYEITVQNDANLHYILSLIKSLLIA